MTASLNYERIVRPFQTVPFSPPAQAVIIAPDEPLEDVLIEIGKQGQVKTMNASSSSSMSSFTKTESKEISRETTERRVENPDDPSQYVVVEDTNKIELESGKQDTYEHRILEFEKAKTDATPPTP